jgi:hypothetical protein
LHFEASSLGRVLDFVSNFLRSGVSNNFLYHAVRRLIEIVFAKCHENVRLAKAFQHLIAFVWNRKGSECPAVRRAFLLEFAAMTGALATFPGWALFLRKVLHPYPRHEPIQWDFEIPEQEMDPTCAQLLARGGKLSTYVRSAKTNRRDSVFFSYSSVAVFPGAKAPPLPLPIQTTRPTEGRPAPVGIRGHVPVGLPMPPMLLPGPQLHAYEQKRRTDSKKKCDVA